MSDLDLDAIRARADAATPGPWGFCIPHNRDWPNPDPIFGATPGDEVAWTRRNADWNFIAHAREDIPALLDEVDRLRRACRTIGHVMDHIYESLRPIIDAAGLGGLIDEDGDGDWELVWEKLLQRVVEAGDPDE